ncbi:MAG: hypothetical protein NDJ90_03210 [Oligoflexia bacterium]|nr:hypothetical protein [Oligoflexia bacterium]
MPRKIANSPDLPFWYQPGAALGSAVRYLASLSPAFSRVSAFVTQGKRLKPGPVIGNLKAEPGMHLSLLIRNRQGAIVGQIDIESDAGASFGADEEAAARRVVQELGTLWSE